MAKRRLRVLLSEGGSTSARQAISVLGRAGHHVEICDPSPLCLGRFSRFVRAVHRCPPLRRDPAGYLGFVTDLLATHRFDVLLPIHEQGLVFARAPDRIAELSGVALPSYASYRTAVTKAGFSRLLESLGLPQPPTRIVISERELREIACTPCVIKTSVGTASRGVWRVPDRAALERAVRELHAADGFAGEVLVQDCVAGPIEHAQAVFDRGELLALHAYRQIAAGAGGGPSHKLSIRGDAVRADVAAIGAALGWHGALSFDVIRPANDARPLFIDCNPRLVEPMSAQLAGLDLVDLLLRLSLGEHPASPAPSRDGVRSHLGMQALLGCALRSGSRQDVMRECGRLMLRQPPYAGSAEELTQVGRDWFSAVPLAATAVILMAAPGRAAALAAKGWGDHLLDAAAIARIDRGFEPA
ncbi:hypothetical protein [Rhodopseudomonas palustris]|nr:hypothetical protein [Rhodopseudomonas palustris]